MDQSTINFLDSLEEKEETNIPINDISIDEVLAEPERGPAIIEDDNLLPPRADDPAFTSAEKVEYEYDEDKRYRLALKDENELLEKINSFETEEELEQFYAETSANFAKGETEEGGIRTPVDWLISQLPTEHVLKFGMHLNKFGAMTVDNLEGSLNALQKFSPSTFDVLDSVITGRYNNTENPEDLTSFIMDGLGAAGEFAETLPALNQVRAVVDVALSRGVSGTAGGLTRQVVKENKRLNKIRNIKTAGGASLASSEVAQIARDKAAVIAAKNKDVSDALIQDFQNQSGKIISKTVNGHLVIDPQLVREAGKEVTREMAELDGGLAPRLYAGNDFLTAPILQAGKHDALVASTSDFKKKFPDVFDNDKPLIDNMFDLIVSKDLKNNSQEMLDTLNDYGITFEDYALSVVNSASEAGTILGKWSQILRNKTSILGEEAIDKNVGNGRRYIMRIENVRRGGLVSQIATASRNLTSGAIRMPLESVGNLMDEAIYAMQNEGIAAAGSKLRSGQTWRDSFAGFKYIFSRPDVAKDYTDLILRQPELKSQFNAMFNNLNEIQKITGRGEGGTLDTLLTASEDFVDFLNTPNRWQEHLMRRGVFFSELQRLSRREYDIDLMEVLQDGGLRGLVSNASNSISKKANAPSFVSLVDEATKKALDITYAKQPEIDIFKDTTNFITRNGLTVIMPFPRFMFNSMELMGQFGAGGSIPLSKALMKVATGGKAFKGPLTAKDRQRISRNLLGWGAVGAAYWWRTSDNAPEDYSMLPVGDTEKGEDAIMNTTAIYPMAQFLYLGEQSKRLIEGDFTAKWDTREFVELFTGSNFRTGVGDSLLDQVAEIAGGGDFLAGEKAGTKAGELLGNFLTTTVVPFAQVIDMERAAGVRGTEFKEVAEDPNLNFWGAFGDGVMKKFRQRGMFLSPEEEASLPTKEYAGYYNGKDRSYPVAKFLGATITNAPSEDFEYLARLGLDWRVLGSKSGIPSIKNFEIGFLNDKVIPQVVETAKAREEQLIEMYYNEAPDITREEFTEREYVINKLRLETKEKIDFYKKYMREASVTAGTPYVRSLNNWRRVPKDLRISTQTYFVEYQKRLPDPLSKEDLDKLTEFSKIISDVNRP
jgi:hypothetical protein